MMKRNERIFALNKKISEALDRVNKVELDKKIIAGATNANFISSEAYFANRFQIIKDGKNNTPNYYDYNKIRLFKYFCKSFERNKDKIIWDNLGDIVKANVLSQINFIDYEYEIIFGKKIE